MAPTAHAPPAATTAWLRAFWEVPEPAAVEVAEPAGAPRSTWPAPSPGTLFLLVMALGMGMFQRLRRARQMRGRMPSQPSP